jgi:hypothetical protein
LRTALAGLMLFVSLLLFNTSNALAGGKDCSGSFTVTLSDGRSFTGAQAVSVPVGGGMTAQVHGRFVEFTVNLNDFTVTNYALTSDITGGQRALVFARKQPLHGKILSGNLSLNLNNEQLVLERSGPGINMKIQAKDCSAGGIFQMEPDQTIEIQHELASGFVYCVDSLDRVLIVSNTNPLIARESPETASLAAPSPKSAIKGTSVSKWLVQGGGRMGFVTGEDAIEPLPLGQPPCAASATPTPSPTPNASPTPSPTPVASPTPTNSSVQFVTEKFKVSEGAGSATITVTRTGSTANTVTVDYNIGADDDGLDTALQRTDFTFTAGTLSFAPSETAKTFTVLINQNGRLDGEREAKLLLSNPTGGAALGTPSRAELEIEDDDIGDDNGHNPIDDNSNFVRQHYHDFLNREPESGGLGYWAGKLDDCRGDAACLDRERTNVSAAFYISQEFQNTGFFVFKLEKASFNRRPGYKSFMPEVQEMSRNMIGSTVEEARHRFAEDWANSAEFHARYDSLTNDDFVDQLYRNAETAPDPATRNRQVDDLNNHRKGRGEILKEVVDDRGFDARQYNAGFVLMQYFGYLRRDPDEAGYQFWLKKLNGETSSVSDDYQSMVRAFVTALEYRERFGQ